VSASAKVVRRLSRSAKVRRVRNMYRRVAGRPTTPTVRTPSPAPGSLPITSFRLIAVCCSFAEEDIIEATVRHAFAQGCDEFLLIDNRSPDSTIELAVAAGAEFVGYLDMDVHRESVRIEAINDVVRHRVVENPHVWWMLIDTDEFPVGPDGTTVREHLKTLRPEHQVVGSTFFNHYPTKRPANIPGIHPIECQPDGEKELFRYCSLGHYKHPLIRRDHGGSALEFGRGAHLPKGHRGQWPEARFGIVTHHFQFRAEADTRRRMDLMRSRVDRHRPVSRRMEVVDAVYAGRWESVQLRRSRLGNRPVKLVPVPLWQPSPERRLYVAASLVSPKRVARWIRKTWK